VYLTQILVIAAWEYLEAKNIDVDTICHKPESQDLMRDQTPALRDYEGNHT